MSIPAKLVSVIIPSYNYGAYISEALDSIRAQTYQHWEVIVVDDGSKDNTAEVVASYTAQDSRIKYYYQQNEGVSAARNKGISLAQGGYIQFLDADDYINKYKLEMQLSVFEQDPEADLVYADSHLFIHSSDPAVPRRFQKFKLTMPPVSGQGISLAMHMAYDNIFLIGSPLFKRSMAMAAGPFDQALVAFEDWHFWYQAVLQNRKFVYYNREGTEFYVRTHGQNATGNRYRMWKYQIQARQAIIKIIEDMIQTGASIGPELKPVLAKQRGFLYEELTRFNLLFENLGVGIVNHFRYLTQGGKSAHIWYDSAYWIKERLLGRNKIIP